jgi:hypothetical protein
MQTVQVDEEIDSEKLNASSMFDFFIVNCKESLTKRTMKR